MRTRSIVLILAVCAVSLALSASDNGFMGTWKLNEAKSKIPAGAGKNTTVVYSPAGDETKVTSDGVDGLGKPSHWEWTGNFDGKPYPVTGMSSIDSRSVTAKGDRILDIANMKDGKMSASARQKSLRMARVACWRPMAVFPTASNTTPSTSSTSNRRLSYPVGVSVSQVHFLMPRPIGRAAPRH